MIENLESRQLMSVTLPTTDLSTTSAGPTITVDVSASSPSTGAGARKVTFNPFSITRKIDKSSPILFQ
jgi:type VI protein secretion system component Hcp